MALRKTIALLCTVMLLMMLLPLGAMTVSADTTNLLVNGDFETGNGDGWDVRSGSSVVSDVTHSGSYAIKSTNTASQYQTMFAQKLSVNANTDYTISYWYYYDGSCADPCCYLYVMDGDKVLNVGSYKNAPDAAKTWCEVTTTFNTGSYTAIWVYIKNDKVGDGGTYYFDDFVLTGPEFEPEQPIGDNLLDNGGFETGNADGWLTYQNTVVSAAAAKSGSYGVNLKGNGGWGAMLEQYFTTKKGFQYILTLDLKAVSNGTNIQVRNVADQANLFATWKTNAYWDTITAQFTATSDQTYLNFCGGGNGIAEDVYVDNIQIMEVPCEHVYDDIQDADCNICGERRQVSLVDILSGGQTSASADMKGLAFRFEIAATGAQTDVNNKYIAGSAAIQPFVDGEYQLIGMGAVITNNADSANTHLLNLHTVNGGNIVNVEAHYLLEQDEDSLAFSVRIVNIPDAGADTTVFARPYLVFEKDGETIVMYDDIVSQNYNAALVG